MCNEISLLDRLARRTDIKKWVHDFTIGQRTIENELYQELFLSLTEMDQNKLAEISNNESRLKAYIRGILNYKLYGKGLFNKIIKGPFRNKVDHIMYDSNGNEVDMFDNLLSNDITDLVYDDKSKINSHCYLDALEKCIPKLNRFEREILETYLKEGTITNVVEKKKVNRRYVHGSLVRAKQHLRELIEKEMSLYE